jgi:hypothetical protein
VRPAQVVAALVPYLGPHESLTIPHGLALALATDVATAGEPTLPDVGSGPSGDFTAADLKARFGRKDTWIRERAAAGDFGTGYRHGRERVYRREDVLLYESRMRGGDEVEPGNAPARGARPLSLVERRTGVEQPPRRGRAS